MPNVGFQRPELSRLLPQYTLIRDAISGETAIKNAKEKYLPMPNAADRSPENKARYDAYLRRAVFYNVTRRTLAGLVGQVFMRDPAMEIPAALDRLVENASGTGVTLVGLSKKALSLTLAYSRCGILVDYPAVDDAGASLLDLEQGRLRPTLTIYGPTEIVNWRVVDRGAEEVLSLVVLKETYCVQDDGFEMKNAGQYRVLRLDESGLLVHEIWREPSPTDVNSRTGHGNFTLSEVYMPTDYYGNRLSVIPFSFIGSENNDSSPDNPIFYDMASLNVAHYRNSADYEEACFLTGQATPVLTGLTQEWVKDVLGGSVNFGSRGGIPLPVGGDAKLLQAQPSSMLKESMDAKERQMVALGARLVERDTQRKTATEASIEFASQSSTLSSVAKNVSAAITWAVRFAAEWSGIESAGISFDLNDDFDVNRLSPDDRKQAIAEWQSGAITFGEMRGILKKAGIATEDDGQARAAIDEEIAASIVGQEGAADDIGR